jgi:arginase family enzyme
VLVLNLSMASVLLLRMSRKQLGVAVAAAALLAIFLLVRVAPWLESAAQALEWRGLHLLASRDSIYGNLTVVETGNIRSLYENGLILASSPDESAAEEAVHYALLEHPAPRRILMIGGGASGAVVQALRHPTVERIDLVELDPALIGMAHQFFPSESASHSSPIPGCICTTPMAGLSQVNSRHIRRDHRECARPADRAVEQVLHRRVLSFRARSSCAGRIARPRPALVGGDHQPRPGGVPALHQPHTARSFSLRRRNSRRDDPLLRRNAP